MIWKHFVSSKLNKIQQQHSRVSFELWDKLRYFEMGLGWGSYSQTENNKTVIGSQFANQWVFVKLPIRLDWNKLLRIFMSKSHPPCMIIAKQFVLLRLTSGIYLIKMRPAKIS